MFSRTVFHGNSAKFWNTMPRSGPGPLTGLPSTVIVPVSTGRNPPMQIEQRRFAAARRTRAARRIRGPHLERHMLERQHRAAARRAVVMAHLLDNDLGRGSHEVFRNPPTHSSNRMNAENREFFPLPRVRGRVREGAHSTARICGNAPSPTLPRTRGRGKSSQPNSPSSLSIPVLTDLIPVRVYSTRDWSRLAHVTGVKSFCPAKCAVRLSIIS